MEYKAENKEFTPATLVDKVKSPVKVKTVGDVFLVQIQSLKEHKRTGYAMSHLCVYNSLVKFNGHLDIYFSDIDTAWLKRYEMWLRSGGAVENTIGIRFRTLRAVYNLAIEQGIVKAEYYPFKTYKVAKLNQATAKRAISKEEVSAVIGYDYIGKDEYTHFAIDLFAFSYYTGGINFVDMAYMTRVNLIDRRLVYNRKKTGKLIRLPLQPKSVEIIERYNSQSCYIFPILSKVHKTEQSQRNRIHQGEAAAWLNIASPIRLSKT